MKVYEVEHIDIQPGDSFDLELGDYVIETGVVEVYDDAVVIAADDYAVGLLEHIEYLGEQLTEAEYQGRKVPLGKPMRGDVKKFKVYVRKPNGKIVKVNFGHGGTSAKRLGQKTMRIKKSNPKRRKSFRARHNCANPGPRWKARYWSCRAW